MTDSEEVHVRLKICMVKIDDVSQQYKPHVNIYFYFKPEDPINAETPRKGGGRFVNLDTDPSWKPHFDFENQVNKAIVNDESYWIDTHTGIIFGRIDLIPHIQGRFDHQPFPFDRQILRIKLLSNNCLFQRWEKNNDDCPMVLRLTEEKWQFQCELKALTDSWRLEDATLEIESNVEDLGSSGTVSIFLQRKSKYFIVNIGFVIFLIMMAQGCLFLFPYNQSRLEFSITLMLTVVVFKFVMQYQIPHTSCLMSLDRYMLFGLCELGLRFLVDACTLGLLDKPAGSGGYRQNCDLEQSICAIDQWATAILSSIWIIVSFVYLALGDCFLRPSWESLSLENKRCESIVTGERSPFMSYMDQAADEHPQERSRKPTHIGAKKVTENSDEDEEKQVPKVKSMYC
mmetsp:Transcript_12505/g.18355  ORF Transcript_12505/g.18355 Transcript_12505/m.18355 type:complete len:400 (-) Transcript_12505:146-1345(-)|eukprot:CAMPEP_0194213930 /NCGR_PEP_ID=MMETSP0156-20130528/14859_1 /TAXON_ID=33649 /ORGANISM="Thalassionema nitzschioides, Strain L26-B" /LENGTH=399 /DNA_ID=CAMNT_0038942077 /DNA_START=134 /DNA_END=1333 /DNA_ORIENTATION=-